MKPFIFPAFLIGVGMGMILSFFIVININRPMKPEEIINNIPDEIIIEKAKTLGLKDYKESIIVNEENR